MSQYCVIILDGGAVSGTWRRHCRCYQVNAHWAPTQGVNCHHDTLRLHDKVLHEIQIRDTQFLFVKTALCCKEWKVQVGGVKIWLRRHPRSSLGSHRRRATYYLPLPSLQCQSPGTIITTAPPLLHATPTSRCDYLTPRQRHLTISTIVLLDVRLGSEHATYDLSERSFSYTS